MKGKERVIQALSILSALTLWEILIDFFRELGVTRAHFIPSPVEVGQAFLKLAFEGDSFGTSLAVHTVYSVERVLAGFALSVAVGVPLGIFIGRVRTLEYFFTPIEVIRHIPPIAWIPFAIILLGIGLPSYMFIIFLGGFFPVVLNTVNGIRGVSDVHIDVAKIFGGREKEILIKVMLPSALPQIFTGVRVGLGVSWMCLIAAEFMGVKGIVPVGLGQLIILMDDIGYLAGMIVGMATIGFVGFLINEAFLLLENRLLKWKRKL